MSQDSASSNSQAERLHAVITEYRKRRDAGQNVDLESLLQAYPDLADELRSYFQGEANMEDPALAATKLGKFPGQAMSGRETIGPGKTASDTASQFTARTFGRYQLLRPLGEGAMGSVYLAQDTTLDRAVALKMPRSIATKKAQDRAEFLQRFTREARAAAGLKHINICSVYDAGEIEGTAYITMDFIDGVPLSRYVGTNVLRSVPDILKIVRVIADAVSHAHEKGIIHRDLKSGNILIDGQMTPFVTDFGLARREASAEGSRITQEGLLIGTPAYMAPEQIRGEQSRVGVPSDIYSLGVIFFELLTARLPFDGSIPEMLTKALRDSVPIPSRLRTDLTEDVDDVVLKMLQKEPERRYQSMLEVLEAIDRLSDKLQKSSTTHALKTSNKSDDRAKSPFEIQKAHIELMLKKGQYASAIRDLETLLTEQSPGAKEVADWARKMLPIAKKEAKALSPAGLEAMLKTAEQLFEKSDYQGCIQLLDEVPSLKRTDVMETLLQKAQQREVAAEELMEQIRDKERRENPEGLEALVKKYLKLKPGNAHAKKLWQALQTYSSTPASRRYYRFERGRLQPMPEISFFRRDALLSFLVAALSFFAVYAYVIIYLKNGSQTLAIHVDDEWMKQQGGQLTLVVDGDEHTINLSARTGQPQPIVVKFGERVFSVKHGDTVVHNPRTFSIERDGKSVLQITSENMELRNSPLIAAGPTGMTPADQPENKMSASSQNEVSDLDKVATGEWKPLVTEQTVLPKSERISWKDGVLDLNRNVLNFTEIKARNIVIRGEMRKVEGGSGTFHLRKTEGSDPNAEGGHSGLYNAWYDETGQDGVGVFGMGKTGSPWNKLAEIPSEKRFAAEQFVPIAFAAIEDRLMLFVEGKKVIDVQDSTYSEGSLSLASGRGNAQFRNVEYQILDAVGASAVSSPPAGNTATLLHAPFDSETAVSQRKLWASKINEPEETEEAGIRLLLIPPGEYIMGAPETEPCYKPHEGPQHKVRITQPFFMGATEITQKQWADLMGTRPWQGQPAVTEGDNYPATYVNWYDATEFCRRLSATTGRTYRLPTEAEWEYSCRAGTTTTWHFGDDVEGLDAHGWLDTNTTKIEKWYAHEVGKKKPNPFGLYDMHGNLFEWCEDFFISDIYSRRTGTSEDPVAISPAEPSEKHITRGGAFDWNGYEIRSALRGAADARFRSERDGLRVVRVCSSSPENVRAQEPANAPFSALKARAYQQAWANHLKLPAHFTNSVGMTFRLIPPGSFTIGSTQEQIDTARPNLHIGQDKTRPNRLPSELPQQRITLTRPFYLGVTEVTQYQYTTVVGTNPATFAETGDSKALVTDLDRTNAPVEMVSWINTGEFCNRLSAHEGLESAYRILPDFITQTGVGGYRLPTEAEWEFACRAGTTTLFWSGDDDTTLANIAWFSRNNEGNIPKPVARKLANPFGLYDMHGNVWEWTHDVWRPDTYQGLTGPAAIDSRIDTGPEDRRVMRGGDYFMNAAELRSSCRDACAMGSVWTDVGFRVALSIEAVRFRLSL